MISEFLYSEANRCLCCDAPWFAGSEPIVRVRDLTVIENALEFYATYETYVLPHEGEDRTYSEIQKDRGDRAKAALERFKELA